MFTIISTIFHIQNCTVVKASNSQTCPAHERILCTCQEEEIYTIFLSPFSMLYLENDKLDTLKHT